MDIESIAPRRSRRKKTPEGIGSVNVKKDYFLTAAKAVQKKIKQKVLRRKRFLR